MTRRELLGAAMALRFPRKVRVGIIGNEGHVSEITGPLPQLPDVEIAAYAMPSPDAKLKAAKHYTDYRRMLDAQKLDVIAVTNDDGARAAAILECIQRKLHVIAEKPLAKKRADYQRIKSAVESSGVKLGMLLPLRYQGHFLAMREIVTRGDIGEVAQLQGQKSYKPGVSTAWRNREESYSGTIPWVGIHMADTMLFASGGRRFVECAAFQARVAWPELGPRENTAGVLYRMDNGGAAMLSIDYLRPNAAPTHDDDRLRVAGTQGVVEYQAATGVTLMNSVGVRKVEPLANQSLFADYLAGIYLDRKPSLTHADIWTANEAVLGAREAAESGKMVKL